MELHQLIYEAGLHLLAAVLHPMVWGPALLIFWLLTKERRRYKKTAYYKITRCPYRKMQEDKGRIGEYETYRELQAFEKQGGRFLFNLYIPKHDGETTEIDLLMVSTRGLFVVESKNYSGWIFGSEYRRYWCQTLPAGDGDYTKEYFYNPVMQNSAHIRWLRNLLGSPLPMWSIVAFSDRCTLKDVELSGEKAQVVVRDDVFGTVSEIWDREEEVLTEEEADEIYDALYPYTQADRSVKEQHIADVCGWSGE